MKNRELNIVFDVDGTLIHDERIQDLADTPNYKNILLFKIFEGLGCRMYIWSGGGIDYAKRWSEKLGLQATIIEKGSFNPDITFDDEVIKLGKVNITV